MSKKLENSIDIEIIKLYNSGLSIQKLCDLFKISNSPIKRILRNEINPEIIGNIKNLEFIPWEDNLSKKNKCSITITQLLKF